MAEKKERIALYIPVPAGDRHSEYRTMTPYFVRITEDDAIRNICGYEDQQLSDLRFYAQWERNASECKPYGWHLEYNNVTVRTSAMATRMAKTLRKIDAIRQNMPIQPTTFGQFVTLLTAGLGVKLAIVPTGSSATYWDYSDRKHQFLTVGLESQHVIDRAIEASWEVDHPKTLALPANV